MESGSKTADYVIEKYPHLFPLREPVPVSSLFLFLTSFCGPSGNSLLCRFKRCLEVVSAILTHL